LPCSYHTRLALLRRRVLPRANPSCLYICLSLYLTLSLSVYIYGSTRRNRCRVHTTRRLAVLRRGMLSRANPSCLYICLSLYLILSLSVYIHGLTRRNRCRVHSTLGSLCFGVGCYLGLTRTVCISVYRYVLLSLSLYIYIRVNPTNRCRVHTTRRLAVLRRRVLPRLHRGDQRQPAGGATQRQLGGRGAQTYIHIYTYI